jgi:hypothetical protein
MLASGVESETPIQNVQAPKTKTKKAVRTALYSGNKYLLLIAIIYNKEYQKHALI